MDWQYDILLLLISWFIVTVGKILGHEYICYTVRRGMAPSIRVDWRITCQGNIAKPDKSLWDINSKSFVVGVFHVRGDV